MMDLSAPQPIADGLHRGSRHAVVIGGGVAGLLAGRVLADHFERLTIVERDALPSAADPRRGVPQGRHIHVLLAGGAKVIDELYPGFLDELIGDGATALDACRELRWFHHGVWKRQTPSAIVMHTQSRPLLEHHLRRRLAGHPGVVIRSQTAVSQLCFDQRTKRVTGVRLEQRGGAEAHGQLAADLVVDASGRGSKTPQWLEAMGFGKPPETTVGIDLAYASRLFHVPTDAPGDWKVLAVFPQAPRSTRSGVIFPIEGRRWIVTLAGCLGDHPPGDDAGFLRFAGLLDRPDLYEAIRDAQPASPIATYRFPRHLRRHYERLPRFPEGLLVLGDALCSFNPLYGQGMSVGALQAKLLGECLGRDKRRAGKARTGLPRRFFRGAKCLVDNPWLLATSSDFLYPATDGQRPLGTGLLGWYLTQVLELSGHNPTVATRFHEVLHFLKPPTALSYPDLLFHVLKWGLSGKHKP